MIKKFWQFILILNDYLNGDFAYKNYCRHYSKHHPEKVIPTKRMFLRNYQKLKYNKINRCC